MSHSESAKGSRSGPEERRLIEAAQRDVARFADLYESYFEIVYVYVARRVRNRTLAEDLTADVFHKALRSLPRFKWTGAPFAAWLFRIASNVIADRARRKTRESTRSIDDRAFEGASGSESAASSSSLASLAGGDRQNQSGKRALQEDLEEAERNAQLFNLLNQLSADQRQVLILRFAEERSIREIAGELGRTEGAIKQLQFRGLKDLRAMLAGKLASESE